MFKPGSLGISGREIFMEKFSQVMALMVSFPLRKLSEAIQKAVPAVNYGRSANRWRIPGQALTPYHFMRAIPVRAHNSGNQNK